MDFVALDFETANAKRSSACSVGIAVVENGKIVETRHWLIKPYPNYFNAINVQIHGIQPADVAGAPTFDVVYEELLPYIDGKIVVAHNASFDISVLRNSLDTYDTSYGKFKFLCTCKLGKALVPKLGSYRLDVLCNRYQIDFQHHNAEADAMACAKLLLKIASENHCDNIADLCKLADLSLGKCEDFFYKPCNCHKVAPAPKAKRKISEVNATEACYCDDDFDGKKFVFTGTLMSMTRDKAHEIVVAGGGSVANSVSSKTNFLITGLQTSPLLKDTLSSKEKKALDLVAQGADLQIIDEGDFLKLIDDELLNILEN